MTLARRDLLLLIGCGFAVLWTVESRPRQAVTPAGVFPLDAVAANDAERLPLPVISDLDGDGQQEVLVATRDAKLYVFANAQSAGRMEPQYEASLLTTLRLRTGRQPVALASGYLTKFDERQRRKQVIVVVTHGWSVLVFNNKLELLWETLLSEDIPPGFYHREIAVTITDHGEGMIIVGGKLDYKKALADWAEKPAETAPKEQTAEPLVDEMIDSTYDDEERHFSYYAFDGILGKLLWKHEAGDFHPSAHEEETLYPQHSFKLHVKSHAKHVGEVPWRKFRRDMMRQFPHTWTTRDDTLLAVDSFSRKQSKVSRELDEKINNPLKNAEDMGVPPSVIHSVGVGSVTPHSLSDHLSAPNVLVAKIETGVEVVHLYSGRTLCQIPLPAGVYGDVNGDGVIDQLEISRRKKEDEGHLTRGLGASFAQILSDSSCFVTVNTGVPKISTLWSAEICQTGGIGLRNLLRLSLNGVAGRGAGLGGISENSDTQDPHIRAATPLLLPRWDLRRSHQQLPGLNSYFFVSTGQISAFSPEGQVMWRVFGPSWDEALAKTDETLSVGFDEWGFTASLVPLRLDHRSPHAELLAVGNTHAALFSAENGKRFATVTLTDPPVQRPVVADIDGDGSEDFVVICRSGVRVYLVHPQSHSTFLRVVVVGTILALLVLLSRQSSTAQNTRTPLRGPKIAAD